jgi:PilZ domain
VFVLSNSGNRRADNGLVGAAEGLAPALKTGDLRPDTMVEMSGDKRDRERVPLEGQVTGEVMVFQPMTILDISLGGAQIETAFALQLDSLHDFRLTLGDRSVVVKGRIAHCQIGELTEVAALYRTGVEFVELSDHAKHAISSFVIAAKDSHATPSVMDGILADEP